LKLFDPDFVCQKVMSEVVKFLLDDFDESGGGGINLSRFSFYHVALNGLNLAIATDQKLLLTDYYSCGIEYNTGSMKVLLDFSDELLKPSCLLWISTNIVCVGFESGLIVCFNAITGNDIFQYTGSKSSVQSMKLCDLEIANYGNSVWILYECGTIISVTI
jgi:hypothetical protein